MSQNSHLFCPETSEAVPLFRIGKGEYTPEGDYSNQLLFHFLAYHEQLELSVTYKTISVEDGIEGHANVSCIDEIEYLKALDEKLKFVLVWGETNYHNLSERVEGVISALENYDFGKVTLTR